MRTVVRSLRRNLWAVFLAHQALLFAAAGFLYSFRALTGRDVRLGPEPPGAAGAAALVALSSAVVARPVVPGWAAAAFMLATVVAAYALLKRFYDSDKNHPRAARREA